MHGYLELEGLVEVRAHVSLEDEEREEAEDHIRSHQRESLDWPEVGETGDGAAGFEEVLLDGVEDVFSEVEEAVLQVVADEARERELHGLLGRAGLLVEVLVEPHRVVQLFERLRPDLGSRFEAVCCGFEAKLASGSTGAR